MRFRNCFTTVRFTTSQAFRALGLITAATLLCTAAALQGDAPPDRAKDASHKAAHASLKDFYRNVAVLPPVSVTDITGNRLEYLFVDGGINLGSLDLEPGYSVTPKGFSRERHAGCYGIHFCEQHLVVLSVEEIDPQLCRPTRRQGGDPP